jgi:hypothetical protein
MKIAASIHSTARSRQSGFSVIIMLALLGMVLAFIVANSQALSGLSRDLNRTEQKQIRRLNESVTNGAPNLPAPTTTNAPAQKTTARLSK